MDDTKAIATVPPTDLSEADQTKVAKFLAEGMPGLAQVEDSVISNIASAYLEGKTYRSISAFTGVDMVIIMYLSQRLGWFQRRHEYKLETAQHIQNRLMDAKLASKDFLLELTQFWEKRIGKKIKGYYKTNDESWGNEMNLKEVDKYLKAVETLHKLDSSIKGSGGGKPQPSPIGLNLGVNGITVEQNPDGSVAITPKADAHGDFLSRLADARRQAEDDKSKNRSDIKEVQNKTSQGEKVDEND